MELSRARKGSTISNKFGYLCMGAIPFNQNLWFKFSATSMQYRVEQNFRNIYPNFRKLSSFLSAFNFAPECLKFLVQWFAFRKRFRKSGNFSGKKFARTTMCKKVYCTCKFSRPIDLSITYNQPRVTSGYEQFAWAFGTFDKITLRFAMNMLF